MPQRPAGPSHFGKARALWNAGRFDEALREYGRLLRESPAEPQLLVEFARALGQRRNLAKSLPLLEKALRIAARRPEVQQAVGDSYAQINRWSKAEACYRRVLRLTPDAAAPRLSLARILERRHALDEAAALVEEVLRVQPQSLAARLLRAQIDRRAGRADRARQDLLQLTGAPISDASAASEAHGALAELYDEQGQYDLAWESILRCKQLLQQGEQTAWHAAQFVMARCRRMQDELTSEHFRRWAETPPCDAPHRIALLTGFPRTGTTLLEQALEAHGDVAGVEEDEFFSAEVFPSLGAGRPADAPIVEILEDLPDEQILAARQAYLGGMEAALDGPLDGRLLLDKNPAMNFMIPPLRRLFPELKLLIALRDPRDVLVSCFLRRLDVNPVSVWFHTLERTAERYAMDMGAWLQWRAQIDGWTEVRYENAVADFGAEVRRAVAGLGLPWDDDVLQYRQRNAAKMVLSPTYAAVAKPVYSSSIGRWRNYQRQLAPVLPTLEPLVRALGYD